MQFSEVGGKRPAGIERKTQAPRTKKDRAKETTMPPSKLDRFTLILFLTLTLLIGAPPARAADWPTRPVTLVVPYAAGGNTDVMARLTAERLSKAFGQTFVVENRTGASGFLAAEYVAHRPSDAYTFLFGTITQISIAPFISKIHYDPVKDFVPVVIVGGNPYVIVVRAQQPFQNLADLVTYARVNPGKLTIGHAGVGSTTHLSAALFLSRAGLEATMVPYKGGGPALIDMMGGVTDAYFANISEIIPHLHGGKLKFLGVSSEKPIKQLPGVPAIADTYPGYLVETWNGLLGPAGLSSEVVNKLAFEVTSILSSPDFESKLEGVGITPNGQAKDVFAKRIRQDIAYWKPVIEQLGIKPE
jgi:tripartite-type tricarboxylate transporter receptor subunit TctC